jgi:hypothetical protein
VTSVNFFLAHTSKIKGKYGKAVIIEQQQDQQQYKISSSLE